MALATFACRRLSLQDRSGRALVAANCKLPMRPRKLCSSSLVMGLEGVCLRSCGTCMLGMS